TGMLTTTTIARISIAINETFRASTLLQGKTGLTLTKPGTGRLRRCPWDTPRNLNCVVYEESGGCESCSYIKECSNRCVRRGELPPWVGGVDGEYACCNM